MAKSKQQLLKEKKEKAKQLRLEIAELNNEGKEQREALKNLNALKREYRAHEKACLEMLKGEKKATTKGNDKCYEAISNYMEALYDAVSKAAGGNKKEE